MNISKNYLCISLSFIIALSLYYILFYGMAVVLWGWLSKDFIWYINHQPTLTPAMAWVFFYKGFILFRLANKIGDFSIYAQKVVKTRLLRLI